MLPTQQLDRIMAAVVQNLKRIDPANDVRFETRTVTVDQVDVPLHIENVVWPSDVQGAVMTVTDLEEKYEYFTAGKVRSHLTYEVLGWCVAPDENPDTIRAALRRATKDLWVAFWSDYHLEQADSQLSGAPGIRLVTNHRLESIVRDYRRPEGLYRALFTCLYDFSADATS